MKRLCLFLAMIVLTSCADSGSNGTNTPAWDIDAEYLSAYNEFIQEAKVRGSNLAPLEVSIKKVNVLPKGDYVLCLPGRRVLVNEQQVVYFTAYYNAPSFRTFVVFHALGHCLLNQPESNQTGIMKLNSYDLWFETNRGPYLHDFFYSTEYQSIPADGIN